METNAIRFDDGAAYEQYMEKWSQLAGETFLRSDSLLGEPVRSDRKWTRHPWRPTQSASMTERRTSNTWKSGASLRGKPSSNGWFQKQGGDGSTWAAVVAPLPNCLSTAVHQGQSRGSIPRRGSLPTGAHHTPAG